MKQIFLSYNDIHVDSIELSKKIKKKYKPQKLVLVSRGGLIPGSIIANRLGIQNIDIISLKTYEKRQKSEVIVYKEYISDEKILVIDDLVDTGGTSKLIKRMMPNSKFVTLYAKPPGDKQADFFLYSFKKSDWIVFPWEND